MAYNAERLKKQLAAELRACEKKYGIKSADLQVALESGVIYESAEVATWVVSYSAYVALTRRKE